MSDDDIPPDDQKDKKESDFEREQKRGPVQPDNEELFKFLDELFADEGEFPQRIDVFLAKGRNKDQVGAMIKQFPFKAGATKPGRERIVSICNEIVRRIKIYTDALKREATYMVGAVDLQRSSDHYDLLPIDAKPSGKYKRGENGEYGDSDDDLPFHDRYNLAQLENHRQMSGLTFGMIEGLLDRSDRQAQAAMRDADSMRVRYIELLESFITIRRTDRELEAKLKKDEMWREYAGRGMDMVMKVLPPMLTAFKGGNTASSWAPGMDTEEARTLRNYFMSSDEGGPLTAEQFQVLFGRLENGRVVTPGILSIEQGRLLADIASAEVSPDALDLFLEGGALAFRPDQFQALVASGISIEILMPLKILFDVRMSRRQKMQQQAQQQKAHNGSNTP